MIKILHVVSNISKANGIMSVIMSYYRKMDCSRINFDFLYFDSRKLTFEDEIKELGGCVVQVSSPTNIKKFCKDIKQFYRDNKNKYDILHIHDLFMGTFMISAKKKMGVKCVIMHSHNMKFSYNFIGGIRNRILAFPNYWMPDYYFACSQEAGEYAFGKQFLKKGLVMNNAIDVDQFVYSDKDKKEILAELGIEGKFVVGHVGGFNNQKNHKFLIEIFESILKYKKDAELVLVSDGPLRMEIEKLCKEKGIENRVRFLGIRSDVNRIMSAFDVFVFPSLYEGLGIVLVEAQANGLPCIFSDVIPQIVNILKNYNKVLKLKDDSEVWAKAAIEVGHFIPREMTGTYVKEKGFDINTEAMKIMNAYERMVGKV